MFKDIFSKLIIALLILGVVAAIYLGAYKPVKKGGAYISKSSQMKQGAFTSFEELVRNFEQVFSYNSPIGQQETVKFFLHDMRNAVSQEGQSEASSNALAKYTESKVMEDEVSHILNMGHVYGTLWSRWGDDKNFEKAIDYYDDVLDIGPNLPHALEAKFRLYAKNSQEDKMVETGRQILEIWPRHPLVIKNLIANGHQDVVNEITGGSVSTTTDRN